MGLSNDSTFNPSSSPLQPGAGGLFVQGNGDENVKVEQALPGIVGPTTDTQSKAEAKAEGAGFLGKLRSQIAQDYKAIASVVELPLPNQEVAEGTGSSSLRLPGENSPLPAPILNAFTRSGGASPETTYQNFIAENPPGTELYEAAKTLLLKGLASPNLQSALDLLPALRDAIKQAAGAPVSESDDTSETGRTGSGSDTAPETNGAERSLFTAPSGVQNRQGGQQGGETGGEAQPQAATQIINGQSVPSDFATAPLNADVITQELSQMGLMGVNVAEAAPLSPAMFSLVNGQIDTMNNWVNSSKEALSHLPPSPGKEVMIDFLTKVSKAIQQLTDLLHSIQIQDSQKIREASHVKLQASLNLIDKQAEAIQKQHKAERKGEKKKSIGVMGQIMQGIMTAVVLIAAAVVLVGSPFLAPILFPILVGMAAENIMSLARPNKDSLMKMAMDGLSDLTGEVCEKMGMSKEVTKGFQMATKVVAAVVVTAAVFGTFTFLIGGTDSIKSAWCDSGIIKNPTAQMVLGVGLQVIGAVAMIVIAVALAAFTGGGSLVAAAGSFVSNAARTALSTLRAAVQMLVDSLRLMMAMMTQAASTASAAAATAASTLGSGTAAGAAAITAEAGAAAATVATEAAATGAQSAAATTQAAAKTTTDILKTAAKTLNSVLQATVSLSAAGVGATESINTMYLAKLQMDLAHKLGDIEEDIIFKEMLVNMLKKMIESLQKDMTGIQQTLNGIQEGRSQFYSTTSDAMDALFYS